MSRFVANVDITTDTFGGWVSKTDILLDALSYEIITANTTYANTGNTAAPRFAQVFGGVGANTIYANDQLRGGNVGSSGNLNITSNTIITGNTLVSSANSLYTNNQFFTANVSATGPQVTIGGNNLSVTSNVLIVASVQSYYANSTVQNLGLFGNSSYTTVQLRGTDVGVSANLSVVGSNHVINGNVNFSSTTVFIDSVNRRLGLGAAPDATLSVTGTANVSSNTRIGGTLIVVGASSLNSTLTVSGASLLNNTLGAGNTTISGFTNMSGSLYVGSTTLLMGATNVNNTLTTGNTSVVGTLTTSNSISTVGPINQGATSQYFQDVQSNTNIGDNTTNRLVYSFPKANYSSGKFLIKALNGSNNQIAEMIVAQNGTTAYLTVYGVVASPTGSSEAPLGTFSANINNANVEISMTQVYSNSSVTVVAQLVK